MHQDSQTESACLQEPHLWCAYPDDLLAPEEAQACADLLNPEERARGERFRFEDRRREHIATHALKRIALSASMPRAPHDWQFQENAHGKPFIDPVCGSANGLCFNLSNSSKLVVCLIAHAANPGVEVGVDVEPHARAAEIVPLASHVFSLAERAQLDLLPEAERPDRALSLWTLKESYIKARGKGLSLSLSGFSFLFGGPQDIRLEVDPSLNDNADRWRFCLLNHANHRIAVMVESRIPPAINFWEAQPILAAPRRLAHPEIVWFPRP